MLIDPGGSPTIVDPTHRAQAEEARQNAIDTTCALLSHPDEIRDGTSAPGRLKRELRSAQHEGT